MRWSKLKQLVESTFAEDVRRRVELWTTRYERAGDRYGRSWITIDSQQVISMCDYKGGDIAMSGARGRVEAGVFAGHDLPLAMREFLTLSIDAAIASKNPLVRMLAVLDRRTGARRLARFSSATEHPLVVQMLSLRTALCSPAAA